MEQLKEQKGGRKEGRKLKTHKLPFNMIATPNFGHVSLGLSFQSRMVVNIQMFELIVASV